MSPFHSIRSIAEVAAIGGAYALVLCARPHGASASGDSAESPYRQRIGWTSAFTAGCLLAIAARTLGDSLGLDRTSQVVALWAFVYVFAFLLSGIEMLFFSAGRSPIRARDLAGALVPAAVIALGAAICTSSSGTASLRASYADSIERHGAGATALALLWSSIAFMVAYNAIGSAVWPLVRPYSTGASSPLRLEVPRAHVVIFLQLFRGVLATLALSPVLVSMSQRRLHAWSHLAFASAIALGVVPLVQATGWPRRLRVIRALEIVCFSAVRAPINPRDGQRNSRRVCSPNGSMCTISPRRLPRYSRSCKPRRGRGSSRGM